MSTNAGDLATAMSIREDMAKDFMAALLSRERSWFQETGRDASGRAQPDPNDRLQAIRHMADEAVIATNVLIARLNGAGKPTGPDDPRD